MFKNVEKTTTTSKRNYYPCVLMGKAEENVVSSPIFYWNKISWKVCSAKKNKVELLVFFYKDETVDGRAICKIDTVTGKISEFRYQDAKTFTPEDFDNINNMRIFRGKGGYAFNYTVNLIHYFGRVNEAEYEKRPVLKEAAFRFAQKSTESTEKHNETSKKEDSSYEPDREKVAYVSHAQAEEGKSRNYTVEFWQKAGHYRHYKSGKVVYIKPTICRPKSK